MESAVPVDVVGSREEEATTPSEEGVFHVRRLEGRRDAREWQYQCQEVASVYHLSK